MAVQAKMISEWVIERVEIEGCIFQSARVEELGFLDVSASSILASIW
jgi:hypothetical protein